jgi:cytochrome c peroxidase
MIIEPLMILALWTVQIAPDHDDELMSQITNLTKAERLVIETLSPLPPPPPSPTNSVADDPLAVAMGHRLFFDRGLSRDGSTACVDCHDPTLGFGDGVGLDDRRRCGPRHTPTLLEVAHQRWFFWDGRADSLWSQALGPMESPIEMKGSRTLVAQYVLTNPDLLSEYESIFGRIENEQAILNAPSNARPIVNPVGDGFQSVNSSWWELPESDRKAITQIAVNLAKCLAAYQRKLTAGPSPFDRFVAGLNQSDPEKMSALSPSAVRGLQLFLGPAGCRQCHFGPAFSDGEFHAIGHPGIDGNQDRDRGRHFGISVLKESEFRRDQQWSDAPDHPASGDAARLRNGADQFGSFRTPSLRNVAETAPYLHHGQVATLRDLLTFYNTLEGQIILDHHGESVLSPLNLSEQDLTDLESFLRSLSGGGVDPLLTVPPRAAGAGDS